MTSIISGYEELEKAVHDIYFKRGIELARDLEDWLSSEAQGSEQHSGRAMDCGLARKTQNNAGR